MSTILRSQETRLVRPSPGWHPDLDPAPYPNSSAARLAATRFISKLLHIPSFNYPFPYDIASLTEHSSLQPEDIFSDQGVRRRFSKINILPISENGHDIGHTISLKYRPNHGSLQFVIVIRHDSHPCGVEEKKHNIWESWDVRVTSSGPHLTRASVGQHFVVCPS